MEIKKTVDYINFILHQDVTETFVFFTSSTNRSQFHPSTDGAIAIGPCVRPMDAASKAFPFEDAT